MRIAPLILAFTTILVLAPGVKSTSGSDKETTLTSAPIVETLKSDIEVDTIDHIDISDVQFETEPEPEPEPEITLPEDEIRLLALLVMAEANGECEEGRRLVIDVVLNRVDSEYFPNSVPEVIYEPGQFEPILNGYIYECVVLEENYKLVLEELANRTNYDVCFFRTGYFCDYGYPIKKVGNHYFSGVMW